MNRTLKRPMFRIGGSAGTGITSGLDRKPFQEGTDPYDRALSTTTRAMEDLEKFRGTQSGLRPGSLPGFLTQFGLNLASATPTGNIFATAAKAAQDPFKTFQAAKMAERNDRSKRAEDIFSGALASEYDILAQEAKAGDDGRKTAEVEAGIITNAQNEIFKQTQGISQIKFLLKENDIFLGSAENQTASADACKASPVHKKVKVCFDEQYMLKAVYYYNNKGEKTLLSNGLSVVKNSFPFNEERFGNLFLNHETLCSQPELTLKTFFEE